MPLKSCWTALALRAVLIVWSRVQDAHMTVKYTDVDYSVFTDAARYVTQGRTPYDRPTYRYSPLLAWILTPNIYLHPDFGKCLFCLLDILNGILIYRDVLDRGYDQVKALTSLRLWLFNPVTLAVSSRGNAESLITLAVLVMLYFHRKSSYLVCGIFLGLAVHLKLYPIIYCLVLYTSANPKTDTLWTSLRPTRSRASLVFGFLLSVTGLTLAGYQLYGWAFLEETYLYHFGRQDVRHNFSPYFYPLYLAGQSRIASLAAFVPQMMSVLALSIRYRSAQDLSWALFVLTYAFVSFNKVVTSQYFLWYLSLLPLSLPELSVTPASTLRMALGWFAGQGIWLYWAYRLEFLGEAVFLHVWLSSLLFLAVNIWILYSVIRSRAANVVKMKTT